MCVGVLNLNNQALSSAQACYQSRQCLEVKSRKNNNFGNPEDFVSKNQQRSIITVAEEYILQTNWQGLIRFDIIAITEKTNDLQHFEDAFY